MGGGGRRRPGRKQSRNSRAPDCPIPAADPGRLSAGSSSCAAGKPRRRPPDGEDAFRYTYPPATAEIGCGSDPSLPILLSGSGETPIVAFVSRNPCPEPPTEVPAYDYGPMVVGGVGLGFRGEEEEEDDMVEEDDMEETKRNGGEGFLSIGGVRVYTEDTSSPSEGAEGIGDDNSDSEYSTEIDASSDSAESCSSTGEEEEDDDDESSDGSSLDEDSDIDDEVAEDYMEGIGGSSELLTSDWLAAVNLDSSDEGLKNGSDGGIQKLGKTALMNASKEYGMQKPRSRKGKERALKPHKLGSPVFDPGFSAMDDYLFIKDPRTASSRKKKPLSQLSSSWPFQARKSRNYHTTPGGKKKQHKELIAMKRRERMINRGVDLDQINLKLRQMVVNEMDTLSFPFMHSRDCSQVRRLASIYNLWSSSQGSSKKRYVTVARTERTCLPSSRDKLRLDKLLGACVEDDDFVIHYRKTNPLARPNGKTKKSRRLASSPASLPRPGMHHSAPANLRKSDEASGRKKRVAGPSSAMFAERPVSFVSRGVMQVDSITTETAAADTNQIKEIDDGRTSKLGAFEMHTKGFGSKMMAKMGFVEGSGLGKEGQGRVNPVEAVQRPKSLGLGVQFTETQSTDGQGRVNPVEAIRRPKSVGSGVRFTETKSRDEVRAGDGGGIGGFERHTKGFGSRMMSKMGFVPGTGLGKDSQGIVSSLTAVKFPKSRGLGSKP